MNSSRRSHRFAHALGLCLLACLCVIECRGLHQDKECGPREEVSAHTHTDAVNIPSQCRDLEDYPGNDGPLPFSPTRLPAAYMCLPYSIDGMPFTVLLFIFLNLVPSESGKKSFF